TLQRVLCSERNLKLFLKSGHVGSVARASARAAPEAYRSAGERARQVRSTASRSSGTLPRASRTDGAGSVSLPTTITCPPVSAKEERAPESRQVAPPPPVPRRPHIPSCTRRFAHRAIARLRVARDSRRPAPRS